MGLSTCHSNLKAWLVKRLCSKDEGVQGQPAPARPQVSGPPWRPQWAHSLSVRIMVDARWSSVNIHVILSHGSWGGSSSTPGGQGVGGNP